MTPAPTPSESPRTLAETYFRAWKAKDFATLRSVLADDATFRGPLGSADGAEECIRGLTGLAQFITDIVIHKIFVDGPDVLTWYDLHTTVAPPSPRPTGAPSRTAGSRRSGRPSTRARWPRRREPGHAVPTAILMPTRVI